LQIEQSTVNRDQQVAAGASHPSREWDDRNTDPGPVVEWIPGLLQPWCRAQRLHVLHARQLPHGSKQAALDERLLMGGVPLVEAEDHSAEVGEIDERADAMAEHQLAWSNRADP